MTSPALDPTGYDWAAVFAADMTVPADRPRADLVADLVGMLPSADPAIRDDTAYPILATWVGRGDLDGTLRELGDTMIAMHAHPEIQARTFATLILGWIVRRDAVTGELEDGVVGSWRDGFAAWWSAETDLRGYDDAIGWLHAIAHGADTVRAFGRSPRLHAGDLAGLLDLTAARLIAPTDYLYAHGEDDRLSYALVSVLARVELADATSWLLPVHAAIEAGEPGPVPPWAANTLRTLNSLYVAVHRGVTWYDPGTREPSPVSVPAAQAAIGDRIAEVLRLPHYYLG